jgi:hypothetical protein
MNTHVLRIPSILFSAVVLAALFFFIPQSEAQMRTIVFSATDQDMRDGFNNGNTLLPGIATVPVTIGIFDQFSGLLTPLDEPNELFIQLLDAGGNIHPGLSVTAGALLPVDSGSAVVTSTLGLHWDGTAPTTATVVVRDTRGLLVPCFLIVNIDPALQSSVRIAALVVQDANRNGVYDASDRRINNCGVAACPPGIPLLPTADKSYILDVALQSTAFPLYLYNAGCPGWRQIAPARDMGSMVSGNTSDTVVFLMQPSSKTIFFSGFRHDLFEQASGEGDDSLLVLQGFSDDSPVHVNVDAAEWRMTGALEPIAGMAGLFSMSVYGAGNACPDRFFGKLSILTADGKETITPSFSAVGSGTYTMKIYRGGQIVYTGTNLSGAAVIVPKTVRQWGAAKGVLTVNELNPHAIQVVGGRIVTGDKIVFEPSSSSVTMEEITEVVFGGNAGQTLALYKHEVNVFGVTAISSGTTLFNGVQSDEMGLNIKGGTRGGTMLSTANMRNMKLYWGEQPLPLPGTTPVLSLEGSCASESCPLGVIGLFRDEDSTFSCHTLPTSYGNSIRSIEVLTDGVPVTTATTTGEIAAQYHEWPTGCRVTTQYGRSGYVLSWDNSVAMVLPNSQQVMGNELRISFHSDEPVRELSGLKIKPANEWVIHIDDVGNDSIRALTLVATITIGGNVFNDKNGDGVWQTTISPEPARPGRKVYLYGEHPGEIDSVITDGAGAFTAVFDTTYIGWAPVYVSLQPASGWMRTNLDYDMFLHGTANQSVYNINFGEKKLPGDGGFIDVRKYGIDDMFASGVPERSAPSAVLHDQIARCGYTVTDYFDALAPDKWFAHTMPSMRTEKCVVTTAKLTMRIRAGHALSYNDGIAIRRDGHVLWSSSIAQLMDDRIWTAGKTSLLSLDLSALPLGNGSTTTLLPAVQNGALDIVLYDDTGIDYLTYMANLACGDEQGDADAIVTGVGSKELPIQLSIAPNPNTGTGTIGFELDKSESVTLVLADVLQREVVRLLDSTPLDAGQHSLQFSLPSLPPGTYFLQMLTGTAFHTRSFVLIR